MFQVIYQRRTKSRFLFKIFQLNENTVVENWRDIKIPTDKATMVTKQKKTIKELVGERTRDVDTSVQSVANESTELRHLLYPREVTLTKQTKQK